MPSVYSAMLTARIAALIALALAPAIGLQAYNLYELHASRAAAVHTEALHLSQVIATDLSQFGEGMRHILAIVAEEPAVRGKDAPGCAAYLGSIATKLPGAFLLGVAAADGQIVCNTLDSAPGAYSLAERGYFQNAMHTGGFAVGDYVVGLVTKRPTIQFATALHNDQGRSAGIVLASIDLDWLAHRLIGESLPQHATLTVSDRNGVVLVRAPDGPSWVGKQLPPDRIAALKQARSTGGIRNAVGLDGRARILGVRAPQAALEELTVTVGLDPEIAFADVDTATRRGLALILFSGLLALLGAYLAGRYFIRRPVERLLHVMTTWRAGDLSVRTNATSATEFGRLSRAFDDLVAALQGNQRQLQSEVVRADALRAQQATLLHELNHRVKNTLATVQSLARQSLGGRVEAAQLESRLLALSKTHDLLTRDEWTGAALREVLENELAPYRNSSDHISIAGPHLFLPPRYVLAIGMTIHELTTNAAKYGALSENAGRIAVTWQIVPGAGAARLHLGWRESNGPLVLPPTRRGFGTRLITGGIVRELDGEVHLDFQPSGLVFSLAIPLPPFKTLRLAA